MGRHESKFIVTQQNVAMNKDGKKKDAWYKNLRAEENTQREKKMKKEH